MRRPGIAAAAMLAAMASPAARAETYTAVSNTAMSITGDIAFDDYGIVFANGEKLVLSDLVAYEIKVGEETRDASVYKVETPADPVLLNGNKLCGNGDVTYVASWAEGDDGMTIVAVFTTPEVPLSDAEMCASYSYE